jgi:hypothetical protein
MSARSWRATQTAWRGVGRWLLAVAWLAQAGCASAPADVLDARTSAGTPVRELVAADRPTVILHYPSSFCFACGQDLGEWVEHDRAGRIRLVLLLADEPTAGTRNALAVRRIRIDGVVAPPGRMPVPREYLVENGTIRLASRQRTEAGRNSPILAAVRQRLRSTAAPRADSATGAAISAAAGGS